MIKLISGTDEFSIHQIIDKAASELKVKPIIFDGNERAFDLNNVFFELVSLDIFSEKKIVVLNNPLFLSSKSKISEIYEKIMLDIIKNDVDDLIFFLVLNGLKFDSKKKIVKQLLKHGELITIDQVNERSIKQAIVQANKKYDLKMNEMTLNHLAQLITSFQGVSDAIEKLRLYDQDITLDVIDRLIVDENEIVLFDLSNALIEKRMNDAFVIYHKLLKFRQDPSGIVYILSSKIRQIYQANTLKKLRYSQEEIAKMMSISSNYAWVLLNRLNNLLSTQTCLDLLKELAHFDQQSKFYMLDKNLQFECWMLDYGRRYGKS